MLDREDLRRIRAYVLPLKDVMKLLRGEIKAQLPADILAEGEVVSTQYSAWKEEALFAIRHKSFDVVPDDEGWPRFPLA